MFNKIKDPGLGEQSSEFAKNVMNADGAFNIKRVNKPKDILDTYYYLINISWTKFSFLALSAFLVVNTLFAFIYLLIGIEEITLVKDSFIENFLSAFFFSSQTLTTLGYGAMSPNGVLSGLTSSIEAFLGLSMFSFLTGLIYGRFSKPKASVKFSKNLVFRDFNTTKAIMFKLVNNRSNTMINPKVSVTLSLTKKNNVGQFTRSFYNLKLERDTITYLPTTWTIVHEIDKDSPFFEVKNEDFTNQNGELVVMFTYFDQSFNQEVHKMHSYLIKNTKMNYKFNATYYYDKSGQLVLDYNQLDNIESY